MAIKGLLKKIVVRLVALSIGLGFACLFGEIVIRILYKSKMVLFPRYHSCVQYGEFHTRRIRPNAEFTHTSVDGTFHFKTNNKGFRSDYDVNYEKPVGTLRVLTLGDSHTQGYEVNQHQTYSFICDSELNAAGIKAQVLNTGVSGFGNSEEMILLENEGLKYKPDVVVLGFYANDFFDNIKDGLYILRNDSLINKSKTFQPGTVIQDRIYKYWVVRYLSEHSYLYNYVFNTVWMWNKKCLIKKQRGNESADTGNEADEMAISTKEPNDYECKLALAIISGINRVCHQQNIKFVLVDIPRGMPFRSSIPDKYIDSFKQNCDTLFYAINMKKEYAALKETHLPHGNRHISAGSHGLIGNTLSAYIINNLKKN